ncbi:hypothetical protein [Aquimarina longa]|uniref:hypothetical protein n=1 Tax=Aquimarina longa TaxID=1080221 RepID=UPI000780EF50|nr:hypothetical protein [Aquimarina longa]
MEKQLSRLIVIICFLAFGSITGQQKKGVKKATIAELNQRIKKLEKDSIALGAIKKQLDLQKISLFDTLNIMRGIKKPYKTIKTGNFQTSDIYNPINFTIIKHRRPAENGKSTNEILPNRSSVHYIKKGGVLHLEFRKDFVEKLTNAGKLNLNVKAFIQRKDNTIKPLSVLGLTEVTKNASSSKETILNDSDGKKGPTEVADKYSIKYHASSSETISAEIDLSFQEVSIDDVVILRVTNKAVHNVGFTYKFVFAEYGWGQSTTGGFSFVQTIRGDDHIYRAAGTAGYAFRYTPKPSSKFLYHFFSPSFGPEINTLQKDSETLIGAGVFVTSFANSVKFGLGSYINGESNKVYFSIGLNFIEGYSQIKDLIARSK